MTYYDFWAVINNVTLWLGLGRKRSNMYDSYTSSVTSLKLHKVKKNYFIINILYIRIYIRIFIINQ